MREMKDSGVEWIGEIPEGWEVKRVRGIFAIHNGSTPMSEEETFWDGNNVWITPAEISENSVYIMASTRRLTDKALEATGLSLLPVGSLIISCRAPIGQVALAGTELCTNQGCKALVKRRGIDLDEKYFFYWRCHVSNDGETLPPPFT